MEVAWTIFICWCFFLQTRLSITLINWFACPSLKKKNWVTQESLSILIPAKDEEHRILPLLVSIAEQDFQNYEVIILDDNSMDHTYEFVESFCQKNSQFRIVRGKSLPSGWKGKNYACNQLAKLASNSFLVFLDADVRVFNGLFGSSIELAKDQNLSLLSMLPTQQMDSFGEKITVPLMNYLILSMMPAPLIRESGFSFISSACGQFMLFPREEYLKYAWHERVRGQVVEDICIARNIKKEGLRQDIVVSDNMISCRMYTSLKESIQGFSRSIPFVFNYNLFLGLFFLLFLSYGPVYCLLTARYTFLGVIFMVYIFIRIVVSYLSRQSVVLNILLHPLQLGMLAFFFFKNFYDRNKDLATWKGRKINYT